MVAIRIFLLPRLRCLYFVQSPMILQVEVLCPEVTIGFRSKVAGDRFLLVLGLDVLRL